MIRIAIAILLGIIRIAGHTSPAYQAVAHLFVGALFGAWLVQRGTKFWDVQDRGVTNLLIAVGLSLLELVCFLVFKFVV